MARILIVEDEPLIAMMLEEWLVELGHQPVGPALTADSALALVGPNSIDAAILDINLGKQRSDHIADALVEFGVPFAFASGGSCDSVAARFASVPQTSKPFDFEDVARMVAGLLGATASSGQNARPDAGEPISPRPA